jgi:hypothetical protein
MQLELYNSNTTIYFHLMQSKYKPVYFSLPLLLVKSHLIDFVLFVCWSIDGISGLNGRFLSYLAMKL